MLENIKEYDEKEVLFMAMNEAERVGYKLLEVKKLDNEENYYLRYVLAYSEKKNEYVTWLFNVSMGGFSLGHYFQHWYDITKEDAYNKAKSDLELRGK